MNDIIDTAILGVSASSGVYFMDTLAQSGGVPPSGTDGNYVRVTAGCLLENVAVSVCLV